MTFAGILATLGLFGITIAGPICGFILRMDETGGIIITSVFVFFAAAPFALLGLFAMALESIAELNQAKRKSGNR